MFERKIYKKLIEWKEVGRGKTALLIEGARRVGKTTIATYFGEKNFPETVVFDFSKENKETMNMFESIPSKEKMDKFFSDLFLSIDRKTAVPGSLIIFDEVQFCPKARQAIKHLVADGRYYYIETGSLISIKENVANILIPSEEESIEMLPMDFEEFLTAIGEDYGLDYIKELFNNFNIEDEKKFHHKFMNQFKLYLAVGGMPQAVAEYVNSKDLFAVHKIKMSILKLYKNDLVKIDEKYGTVCERMWDLIPSMLSRPKSKFIVSNMKIKKDSVLLQRTIEKIKESKMVNYIPLCYQPKLGMKLTESGNNFKLFFADTGLFTALIFEEEKNMKESIYKKLVFSKLDANFGMLYENVIAQILVSNGFKPYFYEWNEIVCEKKKYYEIDFLVTRNMSPLPIEVKKAKNFETSSLDRFIDKYKMKESIILSSKSMKKEDKKVFLPLYMAYLLQ